MKASNLTFIQRIDLFNASCTVGNLWFSRRSQVALTPRSPTEESPDILPQESSLYHWPIDIPELVFEGVNREFSAMFYRTRRFSSTKAAHPWGLDGAKQENYIEELFRLERDLNLCHWTGEMAGDELECEPTTSASHTMLQNTLIVYLYMALREIPIHMAIYDGFVGRLITSLDVLFANDRLSLYPQHLLLWILVVGGIAGKGRMELGWIEKLTADLCISLNICSWEEIESILWEYAWVEHILSKKGQAFTMAWMFKSD